MPDPFSGGMAQKAAKPGFSFIRFSIVCIVICTCCLWFFVYFNFIAVIFCLLVQQPSDWLARLGFCTNQLGRSSLT